MHIRYIYGPKNGIEEHLAREVAAPLIAGGFAEELVTAADPIDHLRKQHPPEGWRIVRGGQLNDKWLMRYDDGNGGVQLYDQVPAAQRVWVGPVSEEQDGHYEYKQLIPEDVIAEFQRLGGNQPNNEWLGEQYRNKLALQQAEQKKQDALNGPHIYRGKRQ